MFKSLTFLKTVGVRTVWVGALAIVLHGCHHPPPSGESATLASRGSAHEKPTASEPVKATPPRGNTAAGPETYEVQAGDSLYKIAANVLGDANRWPEIFELNKDLLEGKPEQLQVGQVLKLPPKEKPKDEKEE